MPLFRRKTASVPPPPSQQQHWVAYMYAPQTIQHVPVHRMYAHPLQTAGPYVQHPPFHLPPTYSNVVPTTMATLPHGYSVAKYAQAQGGSVQYIYHKPSSSYSDSPQHAANPLPVPQHVQQPRRLQRPYSTGQPSAAYGDADRYPFPHTDDEYEAGVQTAPPKQSVFSTLVRLARGRSKSRGRGEAEPSARPRSRASFVDEKKSYDGHDPRERGRTKDPRYVDSHRERRLSNDKELKKVKHESQKSFEKAMMDTLQNSLRDEQMQQRTDRVATSVRRSSTKEDIQRKYDAEDRLRQQQQATAEYERSQAVPISNMRPPSRNRAASPDGLSESPTLIEHTKWNACLGGGRPTLLRSNPDSGYHTDAPAKSTRRSSATPHRQMQRLDLASPIGEPAPTLKVPEGFFNRRGDQLMNSKGDVLRRPQHLEYPPEFAAYPPPGTGWQDHKGQLVGPDLRWIRKVG